MSGAASGNRVLVVEHEGDTGPGLFGARLRAQGLELEVLPMHAGASLPASLDGYAGLLVLGGTPNPDQDDVAPWLPDTCRLIAEAVPAGVPFFGICLGAQLLTRALGGRAAELPGGPEIGLHQVTRTEHGAGDRLFGAVPDVAPVVQWHWVEIVEPPPGAVVLSRSEACEVQALRVGERAWAAQFHLEAAAEAVREWTDADHERLRVLGLEPERVIAEVGAADADLKAVWEPLADRWAQVVLTAEPSRPQAGRSG